MVQRIEPQGAIDAREIPDGQRIESDLAIVGAGAAGISIARALAGANLHVVLIESGGLDPDSETQALARGEVVGRPYIELERARFRFFGGSTSQWVGFCCAFDAIDFEPREWVAHSGWPIDRETLAPYYDRAAAVCQLSAASGQPESPRPSGSALPRLADPRLRQDFFRLSPPTRFGQVYRDDVLRAPNVDTLLHATVVDIEVGPEARFVRTLACRTLSGREVAVAARVVVLAAGGIENPRLLLASRGGGEAGLGNAHDRVGRFFMDNLVLPSGFVVPRDGDDTLRRLSLASRVAGRRVPCISLDEATLRRERLLGWSALLGVGNETALRAEFEWGQSRGMQALREWGRNGWSEVVSGDLGRHAFNVLRDLDDVVRYGYWSAFRRAEATNKIDGTIVLLNSAEQAPNPTSRVTLSTERDRFGVPLPRVEWRLTSLDKTSFRRSQQIFASAVGALDLGRTRIQLIEDDATWPSNFANGYHHLGTTRMAVSPAEGVVDADGRVHGIDNLYVAGGSVFPTSGVGNPTQTIIALALRLADHLRTVLT